MLVKEKCRDKNGLCLYEEGTCGGKGDKVLLATGGKRGKNLYSYIKSMVISVAAVIINAKTKQNARFFFEIFIFCRNTALYML